MGIMIYAILPSGTKDIVGLASDDLRSEVEVYCAQRNAVSAQAGYSIHYMYSHVAAMPITSKEQLGVPDYRAEV